MYLCMNWIDESPAWYEDDGFLSTLNDNNQFNLKNESGFFTTGVLI